MSDKSREYHLISRMDGTSYGGFVSLEAARERAREEGLAAWDIFNGNALVERHEPRSMEDQVAAMPRCPPRAFWPRRGIR